ncbi:MAG: amino acid adenylation domain-containing protein, partial [Acidobacteriota bacterium]|nr:amino acid adenylation domain-containing protein [Acidobacteriota bacterium]
MRPEDLAAIQGSHLCTYLEESARRFPQRIAAGDPDSSPLTYEELNLRADKVARFLAEQGVGPGDRVGVVLRKSTIAFTILFGIMKLRAAYVPVDWTGPPERTMAILTNCQVRVAFADPRLQDLSASEAVIPLDAAAWDAILLNEPLEVDAAARRPDDLAYILYTSGSSGIPKGVMLTQRNATSYVDWCAALLNATEEDRFGNHAPFHFAISILDIFVPIKVGGSVDLVPDDLGKQPKELARFIADRRLTVWYSTPAILGLLADFGDLGRLDFSALRVVLFAGEPFPIKKLRRIVELWPQPAYYNLWGSTETNACTFARIPKPIPEDRVEPYPIGEAGSHCAIIVLDEQAQPVVSGEDGLMYVTGPSVFQGYWGPGGLTPPNFLERDNASWHNTGDVVRELPGEGYRYVSRRDRMVKRRGYRIELAEVERCLYRHPGIAEAAVIALPDAQSGTRIIAHLVAAPDARPSIIEMKSFCNQHLPSYMNPDVFVFMEALLRTSTNKVDYQGLIRGFQAEEAAKA